MDNKDFTRTEKIVKYVSSMSYRSVEYGLNNPEVILDDLSNKDSKISDQMEEIYRSLKGRAVCSVCEQNKLFDTSKEEYYCPIHE
jgi:formate dehydrogenase assembly factor FdhD